MIFLSIIPGNVFLPCFRVSFPTRKTNKIPPARHRRSLLNFQHAVRTNNVRKSSVFMYKRAPESLPLIRLLNRLKIVPDIMYQNNVAGVVQKLLADRDIFVYGVFTAEKGF